jgi:hypothetical protein
MNDRLLFTCAVLVFVAMACAGALLSESLAYAAVDDARLQARVGSGGSCCVYGAKTTCASIAPYACVSATVSCDPSVTATDTCTAATCVTGNHGDKCDNTTLNGWANITVGTCTATGSVYECNDGAMQYCEFLANKNGAGNVVTITCGSSSLCTNQPDPKCQ